MKFKGINFTDYASLMGTGIINTEGLEVVLTSKGMEFELEVIGGVTEEQMRKIISIGLCVPDQTVFMKQTQEFLTGKCPADLGDGRKSFDKQYHVQGDYYTLGRTHLSDGIPTGNWKGSLDEELFFMHVELAENGVEDIYQHIPEEIEV